MGVKMGLLDTGKDFYIQVSWNLLILNLFSVILSSYKAIKEILNKEETNSLHCSGAMLERNFKKSIGLTFSVGDAWTQTRSFCRHSLRQYGTGSRHTMETIIPTQMHTMLIQMEMEATSNAGQLVSFTSNYFHKPFANAMSTIVMGTTYESEDPELAQLLQHQEDFIRNGVLAAGILIAFPFLCHIFPERLCYNTQWKGIEGFHNFAYASSYLCISQYVSSHLTSYDFNFLNYCRGNWIGDGRSPLDQIQDAWPMNSYPKWREMRKTQNRFSRKKTSPSFSRISCKQPGQVRFWLIWLIVMNYS